jgi:hypothetical protein
VIFFWALHVRVSDLHALCVVQPYAYECRAPPYMLTVTVFCLSGTLNTLQWS